MKKALIIAKKEFRSFFDSLIAYVLIVLFLGMNGFFTWLFGNNIFVLNQASLQVFFGISFWSLFFFIPAITMRSIAEETKTGTIELLSTKAITEWDIVLGKFLSCLALICVALACTLPYYFSIAMIGPIDHGAVIGGYIGLIMLSSAYIGIGLLASSLTNNQIVSILLSLSIGIFFHMIFDLLSMNSLGAFGQFFRYLGMASHYEALGRGVIDSRDIIYFCSLAFTGMYAAQHILTAKTRKA